MGFSVGNVIREGCEMTVAPLRPCKRPGCPATTRNSNGYCDKCQGYGQQYKASQRASRRTYSTDKFHSSAQWQRFRNWYRRRNPLCEWCLREGKVMPVQVVDHIKELRDGGEPLSESNVQSLCRACHNKKTAQTRRDRAL